MADRENLLNAVALAFDNDWERAHAIAQTHGGDPTADWLHAVLHKIEGDEHNARYWYRRAGHTFEDFPDVQQELAAIETHLKSASR